MFSLTFSHPQTQVIISGSVRDIRTEAPVAGATVRLAGLALSAVTDDGGLFSLAAPRFRYVGWQAVGGEFILVRNCGKGALVPF